MLLRMLLLFAICFSIHIPGSAFNIHSPITPSTFILDKKKTPKKKGIFNRLQNSLLTKKVEKFLEKRYAQECDIVILNNGEQHAVKVIKITDDEVFYDNCSNESGKTTPSFDVKEISSIKNINGDFSIFKEDKLVEIKRKQLSNRAAFLLGFLLGLFLNFTSIILILIVFRDKKRRRNALIGSISAAILMFALILKLLLDAGF